MLLLLSQLKFLTATLSLLLYSVHISEDPKELGFAVFSREQSSSSDLYFIQPKLEGSIVAQLGPFKSKHVYKMTSISVYLNTHVVRMHRNYESPLFALCTLENKHTFSQDNIILVCTFQVYISSYPNHVFSNSSCLINCVNESECAAPINLDFLHLSYPLPVGSSSSISISYNVTAFQVNQNGDLIQYSARTDITSSLIHHSDTLPPVNIVTLRDTSWHVLAADSHGLPLMQWGVPNMRQENLFSLLLSTNFGTTLKEYTVDLVLSSTLRYRYEKPMKSELPQMWHTEVKPTPFGAKIHIQRVETTGSTLPPESVREQLGDSDFLVIADFVLEEIAQPDKRAPLPHSAWAAAGGDKEIHASGQPFIKLQLASSVPPMTNHSMTSLFLSVPPLVPRSDAKHVFVQFEPRDVLEPPWFPAVPSPEPYRLRVLELTPLPAGTVPRTLDSVFGTTTAGVLADISHHVFCRPAANLRSFGNLGLDTSATSNSPVCPTRMSLAPSEVEQLPPFPNAPLKQLSAQVTSSLLGLGRTDQLVLSLASSSTDRRPTVVPSIYGSVRSSMGGKVWSWREWRGPTVRRWMLEGFQIHVTRKHLRRIAGWRIGIASVYDEQLARYPVNAFQARLNDSIGSIDRFEQTPITVTARIYTMRAGTGQRLYLGSSEDLGIPAGMPVQPFESVSGSSTPSSPALQFDVTRMLPSWALTVRSLEANDHSIPAAYIHHDAYAERPHLIGRWPGRVMLSLVATLDDTQPLSRAYIDVGTVTSSTTSGASSGEATREEALNIVAIRAECVDPPFRLSGHLSAAKMIGEADNSGYDRRSNSFTDKNPLKTTGTATAATASLDSSLPRPQRLKLQLHRIDPDSNILIGAAASSPTHSPEFLRNIFQQQHSRGANRKSPMRRVPASAASCPIHLLSVSLILSDGSVVPTHTVPPSQLRVSAFETDWVWDPATPINASSTAAGAQAEGQSTSTRVLINHLVVWSPRWKTSKQEQQQQNHRPSGTLTYSTALLGAMDDVITAVQSGSGHLTDPGPSLTPTQLMVKQTEPDGTTSNSVDREGQKNTGLNERLPRYSTDDRANVMIASQYSRNSIAPFNNDSDAAAGPMRTWILIGAGCFIAFVSAIAGIAFYATCKRRRNRRRPPVGRSSSHRGDFKKSGMDSSTGEVYQPNGGSLYYETGGSPDPCMRQPGYTSTYMDGQLSHMGSPPSRPMEVAPMAAGLSCSSMGSGNSALPTNSLKQSILMEAAMNPYLMTSEASSAGMFHSPQIQHLTNMPVGYTGSSINSMNMPARMPLVGRPAWNPPKMHPAYGNAVPRTQSPMPWPTRLSPSASNPCNAGYTSGLGSVGTAEGCSDEGVASGMEAISLSQELVHTNGNGLHLPVSSAFGFPPSYRQDFGLNARNATGGTNSTTSGGSGPGPINRTLISTFKRSPTSGIGAGSLSGGSSAVDLNESRPLKRGPDGVDHEPVMLGLNQYGLHSPERGGGGYNRKQLSGSPPYYPMVLKSPRLPTSEDPRGRLSPTVRPLNPMTESFTNPSAFDPRLGNVPTPRAYHPNDTSLSISGVGLRSSITPDRQNGVRHEWDDFPRGRSPFDPASRPMSEDLDCSPVPMPPALLLSSQVCFDGRTLQNRPNMFQNPSSPMGHKAILGSYKRSDSFGMATKPGVSHLVTLGSDGCNNACLVTAKSPLITGGVGGVDPMVGDTLDTSDEVSSGSKTSSALVYKELSSHVANPMGKPFALGPRESSVERSYSHQIPPPEV